MVRSELAERLAVRYGLGVKDADKAIAVVLDAIGKALVEGRRVELRGFGAFSVKIKPARTARNPRLGTTIQLTERRLPYFRCGKLLYERLNTEYHQDEVGELAGAAE